MKQMLLTRGTKRIIEQAISKLPIEKKTNEYAICEEVSNILVDKFIGEKEIDPFTNEPEGLGLFNYQTKRMGLSTTTEILDKIEIYMINLLKEEVRRSNP